MNTELLISCDDWENRVAVLEEDSLAEIYFEREEKVIGSIYKGRVENVLPGMGACFVNIGLGRNAFLYVDDIRRDPINIGETEITDRRKGHTVNELLKVGDDVLVQIVKEPRGLKGARVSTNISLPGRYLVLMPTGRYSGVSSRIDDENERTRLKQIMRRVRPEGMATIVRTAARGVSEAELIADLGVQLRLWHGILESYKRSSAPSLLHKDLNLVFKAVRDFMTSDVRQVIIDSKEQYEEIRSTMSLLGPQYLSRLKLWEGRGDLFEARGIDQELQKLLRPKIVLPSGGYLILEHTEALTVIDVNTGKFTGGRNLEDTLVRTNIEAAAEIARQVRLRDIGGIIVVDFIDMAHERSRQQVIDTLTEALKRDRTRSTIQVFSNLGLLEFTRKRVGKDLAGQLRSDCPYCGGLGDVMSSESLAIGLLRQIRQRGQNGSRGKKLDLVVDPSVATQLVGWYREEFQKLTREMGLDVQLIVDAQRNRELITLEDSRRTRKPLSVGAAIELDLLNVRLPDPASGVAVFEGNIIEVKDGANGAGTAAKIRVTSVDGDLARAELAEPLQSGQRRRRRGRGRGKAAVETEAPIAPPTPAAHPEREEHRPAARARVEQPAARAVAPRRELPPLAYGIIDEEDEEDYTLRGGRVAGGSVGAGSTPRRSRSESTAKPAASRGERGGRGRGKPGSRTPQHPQSMIVGGEGDIDYEDDEDAVVVAPRESRQADQGGEPRARRRRRSGSRVEGEHRPGGAPSERGDYEDDRDSDGEAGFERSRTVDAEPQRRGGRDERGGREERGSREERAPRRPAARHYGPIQQLYGRPMEIDADEEAPARPSREARRPREEHPRHEDHPRREERPRQEDRPRREERPRHEERPRRDERPRHDERPRREERPRHEEPRRDERPPREERPRREEPSRRVEPARREEHYAREAPRKPQRSYDEDELDVVVDASSPAAIEVKMEPGYVRPPRPPRDERPRPEREPRRARDDEGEREPAPRGRRFGRDRDRDRGAPSEPRVARTVKQVYPPPGTEQEPPDDDGPKAAPFASRRTPRGPMMRDPKSEPPPKGKVRQLYPPPEFDEEYVDEASAPPARTVEPETGPFESMFVSDERELDERRRLARERAESRRRDDLEGAGDGPPTIRPPFGGTFGEIEDE